MRTLSYEHFSLVDATPCAPNQSGTCHLQLMALLMALTANCASRYAHPMGQKPNENKCSCRYHRWWLTRYVVLACTGTAVRLDYGVRILRTEYR